jgi:hypothetical protein
MLLEFLKVGVLINCELFEISLHILNNLSEKHENL